MAVSIDAQMSKLVSSGNGGNTLGIAASCMSVAILSSFAVCSLIWLRTKEEITNPTSSATNTSAAPLSTAVAPTRTSRCTAAESRGIITHVGKPSISLRFQ